MSLFGSARGLVALLGQTMFDSVPLRLSANVNDLQINPGDFTSLDMIADIALNITGLQGAAKGRWVVIANKGAQTVTLKNQSGSSQPQNQFNLGADIAMTQNSVVILYGTASLGWLLMASSLAGTGASGTVTSVSATVPDDFVVAVTNPTTTPAIAITHGALIAIAPAAGASNNVDPVAGWPVGYDRLDVDVVAGNANFTGLVAGQDGQEIIVRNTDTSGNTLTLNSLNAGSLAANQFSGAADLVLLDGGACKLKYYGGSINLWVIVP